MGGWRVVSNFILGRRVRGVIVNLERFICVFFTSALCVIIDKTGQIHNVGRGLRFFVIY